MKITVTINGKEIPSRYVDLSPNDGKSLQIFIDHLPEAIEASQEPITLEQACFLHNFAGHKDEDEMERDLRAGHRG